MNDNYLNPVKNEVSNGVKLTNTVYKVLEFFPESDPLKHRAKDKALAIMEHLIAINETSGWASFHKEKIKAQLLEDIDIILGYLWIGKTQGWLNSSNYLIVNNEYEKIKREIKPIKIESIVLTSEKQSISEEQSSPAPEVVFKSAITPRQEKILEYLNKNEKAQVMDLQTIFPDITKRTIRRDLDELLEAGKIDRTGDFNKVSYILKR